MVVGICKQEMETGTVVAQNTFTQETMKEKKLSNLIKSKLDTKNGKAFNHKWMEKNQSKSDKNTQQNYKQKTLTNK